MRILHTADWHLGKIVNEFSMLDLQEEYLNQLVLKAKEHKVDALIMAGDLYDRSVPPKEAIALANRVFTQLTQEVGIPVFVIAGNHDSNERIEYGSELLSASNLFIEGTTKNRVRKVTLDEVDVYLIPYDDYRNVRGILGQEAISSPDEALAVQLDQIAEDWDSTQVNILVYHGFLMKESTGEIPEESESERPLSVGTIEYVPAEMVEHFDYVALGHLHKAQKVKSNHIRYSGSPIKYSKSEANHRKQDLLVDITKETLEIEPLEIKVSKDLRVIRGEFNDILEDSSEDYIFFELTDAHHVLDAMNRLRKKYPYAMGLEYINQKELEERTLNHTKEQLKAISLLELFGDFYEDNIGMPIDAKQKEAVEAALEVVNSLEDI